MAASGLAAAALVLAVTSWRARRGRARPHGLPGRRRLRGPVSSRWSSRPTAARSPSPRVRHRDETISGSGSCRAGTRRQLEGTDGARNPFWSPDSRFIGFFTEERLSRIEVATGVSQTGGGGHHPGRRLEPRRRHRLRRLVEAQPRGRRWRQGLGRLARGRQAGENDLRYPSFLPDGKHVLFYSRNPKNRALAGLWVVSIDTEPAST